MISSNKFYVHRDNICFEEIEELGGKIIYEDHFNPWPSFLFNKIKEGFVLNQQVGLLEERVIWDGEN